MLHYRPGQEAYDRGTEVEIDWHSPGLFAQSVSRGRWIAWPHLIPLDLALVEAATVPNSRIIVQKPPRAGKSMLSSIWFPAWYRLRYPERNIALWSATSRLAQRFSKHTRDISREIGGHFGWSLDQTTKSWEQWKIANTPPNCGEFYASGVGGGSIMGAGGNLLLIDDFFRSPEDALSETIRSKQWDWYLAGCLTRMEKDASIVIVCTRWHRDDLIGRIHQESIQTGEKWNVITVKAINDEGESYWPEKFPIEKLEGIKRQYEVAGRSWMWDALYQQVPPDVIESEWDPSYFGDHLYFEDWPDESRVVLRLVTLDPSVGETEKADYSAFTMACVTSDGHFWVDADLAIRDVMAQAQAAAIHVKSFRAQAFGVESNAFQSVFGIPYNQEAMKHGLLIPIWRIYSHTEKNTRIRAFISPHLFSGRLHFRRNSPGVNLLMEQLRGFPTHTKKDGPDSLAMAIELASKIISGQSAPQRDEVAVT